MAKVRKPVIENRVYSEIILRLGTHTYYVNEFIKQFALDLAFDDDIDDIKEQEYTKERSVLARQMNFLAEEGYLNTITEQEEGKKFKHNLKKYYVNFDKLLDDFFSYYINYLKDKFPITKEDIKKYDTIQDLISKLPEDKEVYESEEELDSNIKKGNELRDKMPDLEFPKEFVIENMRKIKDKKFLKSLKKNVFVKYLIRRIIEEPRQITHHDQFEYTIQDLFHLIIDSGALVYFCEDVEKYFFEYLYDDRGIDAKTSERISDYAVEELKEEYDFFAFNFMSLFNSTEKGSYLYWFTRRLPISFADVLLKGFHNAEKSFYNLK
jgi:hypothetical protein